MKVNFADVQWLITRGAYLIGVESNFQTKASS